MNLRNRNRQHDEERNRLADELAQLRAAVKALTIQRDETATLTRLRDEVERLKLERGRITEERARELREVEHKTGLLRLRQEQDVKHATRTAQLEVREENLSADRERFTQEMAFQRKHFDDRAAEQDELLKAILERLPAIDVKLTGGVETRGNNDSD